jgi:RNA polymerase sigma-70 factor, ECF subfamily
MAGDFLKSEDWTRVNRLPAFKPWALAEHLTLCKEGRTDAEAGIISVEGASAIEVRSDEDRRSEEKRLVRLAQAGDLSAFERLYRENERKVYALCMRMAADAALAEELTQDVFVRAWQKLGSFRGDSAFSSWLYPLTVNVALSERRSRRRRTSRVFATDDLQPFEKPEKPPEREAGFDLEKAMATLPPGARAVFVLHDVEGYKHEEIAKMLGMATGTSKAQLHRARRLLREVLES